MSWKTYTLIGLILVVAGTIIFGVIYLNQSQDVRRDAAIPGGQVTLAITPSTPISLNPGDSTQLTVTFNPNNTKVIGVATRLTMQYSGTQSPITVSDVQYKLNGWICVPTPPRASAANGVLTIEAACTNQISGGFTATSPVQFLSFTVTAGQEPTSQPLIMMFDPAASKVTTFETESGDNAAIPTSVASISIASIAPTATPTPTPTTPMPTATPTAIPTPTPTTQTGAPTSTPVPTTTPLPTPTTIARVTTPTPTPIAGSCNTACNTNNDCLAGYNCQSGQCRNAQCLTANSCLCPTPGSDIAKGNNDTALPDSSTSAYTLLLLLAGIPLTLGGVLLAGHIRSYYSAKE